MTLVSHGVKGRTGSVDSSFSSHHGAFPHETREALGNLHKPSKKSTPLETPTHQIVDVTTECGGGSDSGYFGKILKSMRPTGLILSWRQISIPEDVLGSRPRAGGSEISISTLLLTPDASTLTSGHGSGYASEPIWLFLLVLMLIPCPDSVVGMRAHTYRFCRVVERENLSQRS